MELKPYLDAVRTANDKVQGILKEMDTAFTEGTEEGKQKALGLRPALDQAKTEATQAQELYSSIVNALSFSDRVAKLFVPVSAAAETPADGAKQMTRAAFDGLDPQAKMAFMKAGGKIVEAAAE